jgi:hypothetical protein
MVLRDYGLGFSIGNDMAVNCAIQSYDHKLYLGLTADAAAAPAAVAEPVSSDGLGLALRLAVVAALTGFLVAGLFEWNFGDEELLDLLYTLVGVAFAASGWGWEWPGARR